MVTGTHSLMQGVILGCWVETDMARHVLAVKDSNASPARAAPLHTCTFLGWAIVSQALHAHSVLEAQVS